MNIFTLAVFECCMVVNRIWTMTMSILSYYRFDPDDNHFSFTTCGCH